MISFASGPEMIQYLLPTLLPDNYPKSGMSSVIMETKHTQMRKPSSSSPFPLFDSYKTIGHDLVAMHCQYTVYDNPQDCPSKHSLPCRMVMNAVYLTDS